MENGKSELTDAQVTFSANSAELVLVAAKEDPDTLFFQRKLSIQGDTELGLVVKNLLLSIEFASMPIPIWLSVAKLAAVIEHLQIESKPTIILVKSPRLLCTPHWKILNRLLSRHLSEVKFDSKLID